jgi:4-hydroxybenzoate polyprenyltransferase
MPDHTLHSRRSTMRGLLHSTHLGPSVAVTVVAVGLGVGLQLPLWRLAILGLALLLNQFSVGLSNDWLDAERDRAVGRIDKPIAVGRVTPHAVRQAAVVAAFASPALTIPLGWPATLTNAVFIASAWGYNAALKNTPLSVLPYIVSFGLLPLIATLARPVPAFAAPWALALGALLGVAAHFANVLPDLADDERTGIAGLPHRIGRRASGGVIVVSLGLASALAFFGPNGRPTPLQWIGLVLTLALAVAIVVLLRRPPTRLLFQLIIAAALLNVVVLAFSGDRLLL